VVHAFNIFWIYEIFELKLNVPACAYECNTKNNNICMKDVPPISELIRVL
jgi:hypothetical protein